jgi:hypothetical protein
MKWCRRRPRHRVRVERRRPAGLGDAFDIGMTGRRWVYWCTCNGQNQPHLTQPRAFAAALTHLGTAHDQRTPR